MRHDRLAAGPCQTAGLPCPEDEEGSEAEQDRGREDDHRASGPRVERSVEEEAKPVDHRLTPSLAPPTPEGWA
jgi:hypothetical protein